MILLAIPRSSVTLIALSSLVAFHIWLPKTLFAGYSPFINPFYFCCLLISDKNWDELIYPSELGCWSMWLDVRISWWVLMAIMYWLLLLLYCFILARMISKLVYASLGRWTLRERRIISYVGQLVARFVGAAAKTRRENYGFFFLWMQSKLKIKGTFQLNFRRIRIVAL